MTTTDTKTSQSNRQSHPGYVNMITQAIVSLNGYGTLDEISNYIANNWKSDKYKILNGSGLTSTIKRNLNKPGIFNLDNKTKKYNIIIMKQSIPPFGDKECGRNAVYVNGEIIVSPGWDNHIYKFNTKSKTWSKYKFGNYKNIRHHAVCSSNDK
eukprot:283445_1